MRDSRCDVQVLAILELLKHHKRVLYIDIDIHHGDGVEEAFYTTDRVLTVSFHKFGERIPRRAQPCACIQLTTVCTLLNAHCGPFHRAPLLHVSHSAGAGHQLSPSVRRPSSPVSELVGEYFPGTGDVKDVGALGGKYYSVNFPLKDGMDDRSYSSVFKPVIGQIMQMYQPGAIVLQCGADSLCGDRLGCFNLSIKGHADCVRFVLAQKLPTLILGGGGYTIRNVSRCWTYETAVILGAEIDDELPYNDYYEYYGPDYRLHFQPSAMENLNIPENLEKIKSKVFEHLRQLQPVPNVQMHQTAPSAEMHEASDDDDPDRRISQRHADTQVEHPAEF